MKKISLFILLLISANGFAQQVMNAVIGDTGWQTMIKGKINPTEKEKIQAHLLYAETYLRLQTPEQLTDGQLNKRLSLLNQLAEYRLAGAFPLNEDFPGERRPHFIDSRGTICAVGYLVEKTAGRAEAERINSIYSYARIAEMHDTALSNWMNENGLTVQECAMIQPQYYFGEGPTLEALPIDSLPDFLARKIKYDGKADTAFISFVIKKNGAFSSGQVDSGNAVLGNAALDVLAKQKYNAAWSHGMGDPANYYNSKVTLKIFYGITNENISYADISYKKIDETSEDKVLINGIVSEKSTGELLPGVLVKIYNDSGKLIGACVTDVNGVYKISLQKNDSRKIRVEYNCLGYETATSFLIEFSDCEISAKLKPTVFEEDCKSLSCLQKIYIKSKGA